MCDVVIALRSRTEVIVGVFVDENLVITNRDITDSLLETCEDILLGFGFHVSSIARLGVVNIQSSFTSTRLLMLLANMMATFSNTKVALLPIDFLERSSIEQRCTFMESTFSDSLFLGYNGEPNITTPKQ